MFLRTVTLIALLSGADSIIKIFSIHPEGSSKVCLSNQSPAEVISYYWSLQMDKLAKENYMCSIGDSIKENMDVNKIRRLVKQVGESPTEISFQCQVADVEKSGMGVSYTFNGIDDTVPGTHLVDCDNGTKSIGVARATGPQINRLVGPPPVLVEVPRLEPKVRGDLAELSRRVSEAKEKEELMTKEREALKSQADLMQVKSSAKFKELEEQIAELKEDIIDREFENNAIKKEMRASEAESVALREEINGLHEILKLEHEAKKEMNRSLEEAKSRIQSGYNMRNQPLRASLGNTKYGVRMTTVLPVLTAFSLLSAGAIASGVNDDPHFFNRQFSAVHKLEESDEESCKKINYGTTCRAFRHLSNITAYPFFNSHHHLMTPLEARAKNIISLEANGVCQLGAQGHSKDCWSEAYKIKAYCPNGHSSAYYLDQEGKIRGAKCEQDHELSEDCSFCRKIKANDQIKLEKGSIQMQDVVCQEGSIDYNGPKVVPKGFCGIGPHAYKKCFQSTHTIENVPFVIFQNKGKMYLDSLILRNPQKNSITAFLCYEHKGQPGGSIKEEQERRELSSVLPTECKQHDSSKTRTCIGDPSFCSVYNCAADNPSIWCQIAENGGALEVLLKGVWVKPKCVGYERTYVRKEVKPKVITHEETCETCVHQCRSDGIIIRSTGFKITSAVACAQGSCVSSHQQPHSEILVPYPGSSQTVGGEIGVHMAHEDEKISSKVRVYCGPQDPCVIHSCILCAHGLINYHCHTALSAFIAFVLLTSCSMIIFLVLWYALRAFRVVPSYMKNPFKWSYALLRWMGLKFMNSMRNRLNEVNENIGWDVEAANGGAQRQARQIRPIPRYATGFLFLSLIMVSHACTDSVIASSKIVSCRLEGGKTLCRVNGVVTIKAGVIGGEACVILKGHTDGQRRHLSIKTLSSEMTCREGQSFWTGQFTPECFSSRRCRLVGECKDDVCQEWNSSAISKEFSSMTDNEYMTENKCFDQCGGWGCSCFNVNPSCLFVHARFVSNRKEAVRVFNCVDWVHKLHLLVTDAQQNQEEVTLASMGSKFFSWGAMSLSLDAESVTSTNSLSFLQSGKGLFALHDEALTDIPREGFIGEIRCASEAAVTTAHTSCKRAPNLIKYRPMMDQAECVSNLVDPFSVFLRGALPQSRNGMTFTSSLDGTGVQAMNSGSIRAQITLNFDDYDIEFETEMTKCEASFLNVTGCYSCNVGARICVKVKSSGSGSFIASSKDKDLVFTAPVSQGTRDICSIVHFSKPEIDEEVFYGCGGEDKMIVIRGTLSAVNPFDDRNQTGGNSIIVNPDDSSWSLLSWFSGFMKWMGGPLKTILLILLYVFLSLIFLFTVLVAFKYLIKVGLTKLIKKEN
uniref:Envelopment polyprotein n=1 Tax=Rio Grande virus TaxID=629740 RepID=A0A4P8D7T5_9VIRU|nr:Glycoprotein precursor [Rio Grande virus]